MPTGCDLFFDLPKGIDAILSLACGAGGICPVARCAKHLVNGPCGGSSNGLCEISISMGREVECAGHLISLQSVYGDIGQFFFKVIVHQVFIFVLGVVCCAGPAAKINFCSGSFDG
jgi:hypothetical protein